MWKCLKHIIPNFISGPAHVEVTDGRTLLIGHTWQHTFIRPRFAEIYALLLKETVGANQKVQKTDVKIPKLPEQFSDKKYPHSS